MRLFKKLRRRLDYLNDQEIDRIKEAYVVAHEAHKSQKRRTGEPYITHPVAVACILADIHLDPESIMAALLHDVLEDTTVEKKQLNEKFGEILADIVDGVSKLTQIEFISPAEAQAENFCKMVLAMAKDIRVILVKLADRLHNLRTLGSLPRTKRKQKARETLEIFAPIAKRLGMREFSVEMEELSFQQLYPLRYRILRNAVRKARGNRKKVLDLIDKTFQEGLKKASIKNVIISGREKHLYSIYRKMKSKNLPFNEIMDVYAFRIIVDEVDICYRVLGIAHSLYKPVPERFKDYIAIPKANGYQSLHTTLFGPYGLPIEVQIKTKEMHEMATSGIAAHWIYKSGQNLVSKTQLRAQQWVNNLLELQQTTTTPMEFIESVKMDLFPDEVYVFTPKGHILGLPSGATVIDFAYAVHTEIGNTCIAARVDRQFTPLSTILRSGQTIEVITSATSRPSPAWLDFVITSKARSSIRLYLKSQRRSESIQLGKQLLKQSLKNANLSFKQVPNSAWEIVCNEAHLNNVTELLVEIGLGNRAAPVVAQRILSLMNGTHAGHIIEPALQAADALTVKGTEGMLLDFAECCYPIPNDPIVGVLKAGRGIVLHNSQCSKLAKLRRQENRCVPMRWADNIQGEFRTKVYVQIVNKPGALANIASIISDMDSNIDDISITERDDQHHFVCFRLMIKNRIHLARILRRIRQLRSVVKIMRAK